LLSVDKDSPSYGRLKNGDEIIQVERNEINDLDDFLAVCDLFNRSLELNLSVVKKTEVIVELNTPIEPSYSFSKMWMVDSIESFLRKKLFLSRSCKSNKDYSGSKTSDQKSLKLGTSHRFSKNPYRNFNSKNCQKKYSSKQQINEAFLFCT